jgi:lipoprotein NlpI
MVDLLMMPGRSTATPRYAKAYFNRAGLRLIRGEYDDAISDYGHAIELQPNYAEAYRNRADAHQMKGEIDKAIADYSFAIRFNSFDPATFANRGAAYASAGEFERAVTDFSSAIALKPEVAEFHFKRALSRMYVGQVDGAMADLKTTLELKPSSIFAVIWLHVAHVRAAVDDTADMKQVAAKVDRNQWPKVILQLFIGGATQDELSTESLVDADEKTRTERKCLAAFYLGLFNLEKGDATAAGDRLQAARESCPPALMEFAAAKAELLRLQSR